VLRDAERPDVDGSDDRLLDATTDPRVLKSGRFGDDAAGVNPPE
jgi:hypothetical protein